MNQETLNQKTRDWAAQALTIVSYSWAAHKDEPALPDELSGWLQLRWTRANRCVKAMIEMNRERAKGDYWLGAYNLYGDDPFTLKFSHYDALTDNQIETIEGIIKGYLPLIKIIRCHNCEGAIVAEPVESEWLCSDCFKTVTNLGGKRFGYLYLFGSREMGYYKIGQSVSPNSRLRDYELSKLPFRVKMIHTFPADDTIKAEREIHRLYKQKRTNGEWFKLSPDELQGFTSIKGYRAGQWIK